ncbi:(2Fe-2S)-binding protein [Limnohabitans sp. Rim11]|uniref:(2Fe-2S)-binding protein n=1 Tax=Limnohabitans sp. Rim11 TaxID=1100719 RepID=UPI000A56818F|nr:2Fe-2S iron-sulfur cluster-binding protein [Limnohabitans sp. Rim11]
MLHTHSLKINGESIQTGFEGAALQLIRNQLGLTASRFGCGQEQCGACHVLIDGQSKPSCQMTVDALVGRSVVTLESAQNPELPSSPYLNALQAAFIDEQAAQCGYCTSGLLISAVALLMSAHETVSDLQIREALEPHLCRCGTHNRVLRAVKKAALQCGLKVTPSEVSA